MAKTTLPPPRTQADDLFDQLNDLLTNYDPSRLDHDQENFILYLDIARRISWDIPSALGCDHIDKELPMHRHTDDYPSMLLFAEWNFIDDHYKDIHGLDLKDSRINWSFDT